MTPEDKDLLLKDLCARLPYMDDLKVARYIEQDGMIEDFIPKFTFNLNILNISMRNLEFIIKPYLRPMSSMTEEEIKELSDYLCEQVMSNKIGITIPPNPTHGKGIPFIWMGDCLDWLNAHHFDYRGLIEKGLALEAPEGMYKTE